MSHATFHAISSVHKFGGVMEDYLAIHQMLDSMKIHVPDNRHRIFFHHTGIIPLIELAFGDIITNELGKHIRMPYITNSNGKKVPIQYIVLQHLKEDNGGKPMTTEFVCELIGLLTEENLPFAFKGTARKLEKELSS